MCVFPVDLGVFFSEVFQYYLRGLDASFIKVILLESFYLNLS